ARLRFVPAAAPRPRDPVSEVSLTINRTTRPIIALVTDFGTRDHYAGVMKGVIAGICPDALLIDISHEVPPQDLMAGTLSLAAACPYFPPGTIFLVVVDPGVGSTRKAVAVEAGPYMFVAPDNGVLTAAIDLFAAYRAVDITSPRYTRPVVSPTF